MSARRHHDIERLLAACPHVPELLDMAETCLRTARLLNSVDSGEAAAWSAHAQAALARMRAVRAMEVAA